MGIKKLRMQRVAMGCSQLGIAVALAAGSAQVSAQTATAPANGPSGAAQAAQQPTQAPQAAPGSDASSEDIVITARKRPERLLDIPQSISVLTADDLQALHATQFRDFANTVPGLSYTSTGPGTTQVSLRGITTGFDVSSTVGIYVDDVPYGSSGAFAQANQLALDVGVFDLERVEVLRGPQGTLYGSSTMGGLLKYVTRAPTFDRVHVEADFGLSDTRFGDINYNASAAINLPLAGDVAALRVSGYYAHDGGYIDNVTLNDDNANRSRVYGGRADLLLQTDPSLSIRLTAFAQNIFRGSPANVEYNLDGTPQFGDLIQTRYVPYNFDQQFRLVSGTIAYHHTGFDVTSITSYQTNRTSFVDDQTLGLGRVLRLFFGRNYSSVGLGFHISTDKFTQELRVASGEGGVVNWLVGGFYTNENSHRNFALQLRDAQGQPAVNDLLTAAFPSTFEEYAGFGDLTVNVTPRFHLTGGLRFAHNHQKFEQIGSGLLLGSTPLRTSSESTVTYLASANYQLSHNATIYARYASGYRPGGPNFVANDPVTHQPIAGATFEADRLDNYEVGFKLQSPDRHYSAELSAYYIDWSNVQLLVTRGSFSVYTNAPGGAISKGIELNFTARPIDRLTISGAGSIQHAYLSAANAEISGEKGERLPNVPRFMGTLSADYVLNDSQVRPTIGATYRYVGSRTRDFISTYHTPGYSSFDLRASVHLGQVQLSAFARNLFDSRGQISAQPNQTLLVTVLQPRTIGLALRTDF